MLLMIIIYLLQRCSRLFSNQTKSKKVKSIKYGNGSYNAESVVKLTREEYIAKNKKTAFKGMPESNVVAKLGEIWDLARAAVPVEVAEPAPVVEPAPAEGGKNKNKPKPAGGGETAE